MMYQQELDNYGTNGATGTWGAGEQFTHSFILVSASQLDEFIQLQANEATGINIRTGETLTAINTGEIQPGNDIVLTGTWAVTDLNYFLNNQATQSLTTLDLTQIKVPVGEVGSLKNPNTLVTVKEDQLSFLDTWKNVISNSEATHIDLEDGRYNPFYAIENITVTDRISSNVCVIPMVNGKQYGYLLR